MQPLRWEAISEREVLVDLRCPECQAWMQLECSKSEMAELDRLQAIFRAQIAKSYERAVAENMEELAVRLRAALELDLLDADDFARAIPRPRPAGSSARRRP